MRHPSLTALFLLTWAAALLCAAAPAGFMTNAERLRRGLKINPPMRRYVPSRTGGVASNAVVAAYTASTHAFIGYVEFNSGQWGLGSTGTVFNVVGQTTGVALHGASVNRYIAATLNDDGNVSPTGTDFLALYGSINSDGGDPFNYCYPVGGLGTGTGQQISIFNIGANSGDPVTLTWDLPDGTSTSTPNFYYKLSVSNIVMAAMQASDITGFSDTYDETNKIVLSWIAQ